MIYWEQRPGLFNSLTRTSICIWSNTKPVVFAEGYVVFIILLVSDYSYLLTTLTQDYYHYHFDRHQVNTKYIWIKCYRTISSSWFYKLISKFVWLHLSYPKSHYSVALFLLIKSIALMYLLYQKWLRQHPVTEYVLTLKCNVGSSLLYKTFAVQINFLYKGILNNRILRVLWLLASLLLMILSRWRIKLN